MATGSGQNGTGDYDRAAQFNRSTGQDSHPVPRLYVSNTASDSVNGMLKACLAADCGVEIACAQPETGSDCPRTHVKRYDDDFVYVLFQTADQFVRAVAMTRTGRSGRTVV